MLRKVERTNGHMYVKTEGCWEGCGGWVVRGGGEGRRIY